MIVGSHRDAWGRGAVDPGGGTATMLEISRVVGQLMKTGWRPRRTVIFASWGAEEYGLIGSTEWVEVRKIFYLVILVLVCSMKVCKALGKL